MRSSCPKTPLSEEEFRKQGNFLGILWLIDRASLIDVVWTSTSPTAPICEQPGLMIFAPTGGRWNLLWSCCSLLFLPDSKLICFCGGKILMRVYLHLKENQDGLWIFCTFYILFFFAHGSIKVINSIFEFIRILPKRMWNESNWGLIQGKTLPLRLYVSRRRKRRSNSVVYLVL